MTTMKTGLILIPNEDEKVNETSDFFTTELAPYGSEITTVSVIGNSMNELEGEISSLIADNELIVISGKTSVGLAVGNALSVPAALSEESFERISEYFTNIGEPIPLEAENWALVPEGAQFIENDHGPINGFLFKTIYKNAERKILFLPSRVREFLHMFNPAMRLLGYESGFIKAVSFGVFGLSENTLTARLSDLLSNANPYVNLYSRNGEAWIQVLGKSLDEEELEALMNPVLTAIKERLGINIYSIDSGSLPKVAVTALQRLDLTLSIAEDASVGRLGQRISEIPKADGVIGCTLLADDENKKMLSLGFSENELYSYKRSGPEMTALMAHKVRKAGNSDIGFAISEIGNEKIDEAHRILVMHVALADDKRVWIKRIEVPFENRGGESTFIRFHAVSYSLDLIRRYLEALPMVMAGGETLETLPYFSMPSKNKEADFQNDSEDTSYLHAGKQNKFSKLFLPSKEDPGFVKFRKISIISLLIILILFIILIFTYERVVSNPNKTLYNKLTNLYSNSDEGIMVNLPNAPGGQILAEFSDLYSLNEDIRGWIKIENTNLDYPVMKGGSNFYKSRDFEKNPSSYGVPYFTQNSYLNSVENDSVLSIYGNNSGDNQMFSDLVNYEDLDFFKNHTTIEMNTIYQKAKWKIFSVMIIPDPLSANKIYDYTQTVFNSETEDEKVNFINNMKKYSIFDAPTGEDFTEINDSYLFLATDYTPSSELENAQIVVVARKVRAGESLSNNLDYSTYKPEYISSKTAWFKDIFKTSAQDPSGLTSYISENETESTKNLTDNKDTDKTDEDTTNTVTNKDSTKSTTVSEKPAPTTTPTTAPTLPTEKPDVTQPIPSPDLPSTIPEHPPVNSSESVYTSTINVLNYSGGTVTKSDWQKIISMVVKKEVNHYKFDDEVLRAQAITSYTKAIHDKKIDLANISFNPTAGSRDEHIFNIVGEVIGQKMMYDNKAIVAFCFASAPGVTLDNAYHFGANLPYLKPVESKYDSFSHTLTNSPKYSESVIRTYSALMATLSNGAPAPVKCDNNVFRVTETDPYGVFVYRTSAYYENDGQKIYLTGKNIREFSSYLIRSTAFTVSQVGDNVTLTTTGYGHGVGLSQHGANGYAINLNWNYKQILAHYFSFKSSGTKLVMPNW